MHTSVVVTLGSLATVASASALDNAFAKRDFTFPATVPMHKRAVTGAEYQCHANCGYTILNAEDEGYCDDSDWKDLYEACLECANTYDMWNDYGAGVEGVAAACGLTAVPSGSSEDASSVENTAAAETTKATETTAAVVKTTEAAAGTTDVAVGTSEAIFETSASAVKSTQEAIETSTTALESDRSPDLTSSAVSSFVSSATTVPSGTAIQSSNGTTITPLPTPVQGGASMMGASKFVAAGAALLAFLHLM